MVSKNSSLGLQRLTDEVTESEGEGEKQNSPRSIFMYLKALKDVLKPLVITPGKGRKFVI